MAAKTDPAKLARQARDLIEEFNRVVLDDAKDLPAPAVSDAVQALKSLVDRLPEGPFAPGVGPVPHGRSLEVPDLPSSEEIQAARTPAGGWKRDQLAAWGIPWPPPKGWKGELAERWRAAHQDGAPPPLPSPAPADFAQETFDFG
ncbi:hypothetical protein OHS81_01885 [Streptomyces sp. NBC_00400]|uniref:hypothetical protein n=1 Tax=Streptomyces sp. NBC_00400 TaxID=2975737 RepID=UPI002E203098